MNRNIFRQAGVVMLTLIALLFVISWGGSAHANNNESSFSAESQITAEPDKNNLTDWKGADRSGRIIIDAALVNAIQAEGAVEFFIWMREQADLSPAYEIQDRDSRRIWVYETLRETAERSQAGVRAMLDAQGYDYQVFVINNSILVHGGDQGLLSQLAVRDDIYRLLGNYTEMYIPEPEQLIVFDEPAFAINSASNPVWNISIVNADDVWEQFGVTGAGVIVANIDTGVQYTHPALVDNYRGNLGGSSFSHAHNWLAPTTAAQNVNCGAYTPSLEPCDHNGHGTHVMGTSVGGDGLGPFDQDIGMAPDALWIACMGCDGGTGCSSLALTSCAEWMLAPSQSTTDYTVNPDPTLAPDVVNNSWGGGSGDPWYLSYVTAWRAADIIPVFAAGNSGSTCSTIGSPSGYNNVLSVGGTDSLNRNYTFTSRGPGTGTPSIFPVQKPDISAPGEGVRSSVPGNGYSNFSGTSMASPHVAGLIALLLSVNPDLDYDDLFDLMAETAYLDLDIKNGTWCGGPGLGEYPNYVFGHGRIDAFAAVEAAIQSMGDSLIQGQVTDQGSGDPIAGANILATSPDYQRQAISDATGMYRLNVFSDTYTIEATAFGYLPTTIPNVVATTGMTTTQDIEMVAAASYTVSGAVTDANTGWPLYARISVAGVPGSPFWNDPVTGAYSITLPGGSAYDFTVEAFVAGYLAENQTVGPFSGNITADFGLAVDAVACVAPGYEPGYTFIYQQDFEANNGDFVVSGTPVDHWQWGAPTVWPNSCASGTSCWGTNLSGNYANNANTVLTSPEIDLSGESGTLLAFWNQANHVEHHGWDQAFAEVSIDGGAWQVMWQNPPSPTVQEPWRELTYNVSAAAGGTAQFRFRLVTDSSVTFSGYYVDDVAIASAACLPEPGGLVVGNVYDANTNSPLTGALVSNDYSSVVTVDTPLDPSVDDAFYTIFSPAGSQVFTATLPGYSPDIQLVDVVVNDTVGQDFYLGSGFLVHAPEPVEVTVEFGLMTTAEVELTNTGSGGLNFTAEVLNTEEEHFEGAFPPDGWSVVNYGGDCVWQRNDQVPSGRPNYAGGDGFSANADSDRCGSGSTMNTGLISPKLDLSGAGSAHLDFILAYQHLGATAFAAVDISTDDGANWTTLQSWNTSQSPTGPGLPVSISLNAHLGSADSYIRFHYFSPGWNWWYQVDQVEITIEGGDWLEIDTSGGFLAAGESITATLSFDASAVDEPGQYIAYVTLTDDTLYDPDPITAIMNVTPSPTVALLEGVVQSQGYCDANPFPAAGAEIVITSGTESWTRTADENGYYYIYLDESYSPVTVTANAPEHISETETGVVLIGQQTTTLDFDLRWEQPCISTAPSSFDVELGSASSATRTLTIDNNGGGALNWAIHEADMPEAAVPQAVNPLSFGRLGAAPANGAVDLVSLLGAPLPAGLTPVALPNSVVDCAAEPGIIIHDDGTIENGYSGNPDAGITEVRFVDRFTPSSYPASFRAVCVAFLSLGPASLNFDIVVYAADGPGGAPGTLLGSQAATAVTPVISPPIPPGYQPTWNSYDISGMNLQIASGSVYIGVRYAPSSPNVFIASDESAGNPVGFAGGYWWNNNAAAWATIQTGFTSYRSLMVRAVEALDGCSAPSDLPWVSVSPASGTIDADDSGEVVVSFDSTGLTSGETYSGLLCLTSNDPTTPLVQIPVSLTVEPSEDDGRIAGTVQSLGYCDLNPFPAEGAEVVITSGANSWTVYADANGAYGLWLDAAYSPVDISVTAPNHTSGSATGVVIVPQEITTVDFDLRWLQPCVSIDPESFDVEVGLGSVATYMLHIHNSGAGATAYAFENVPASVLVNLPAASSEAIASQTRQPTGGSAPARSFATPLGLPYTDSAYTVLLLTPDTNISDLQAALAAFSDLTVTTYAGNLATLTAAELLPYDVVMTTNNTQWAANAVQVGNALADYVDLGGRVILNNFAYDYIGWELDGRFMTEGYGPFAGTSNDFTGTSTLGTIHEPDHPIMTDVTAISNTYLWQDPTLAAGAVRIADWSDGNMFVAANDVSVALNVLPSDGNGVGGWTGDLATLYRNAIIWLAGGGQPPQTIDWLYQQPLTGTIAADSSAMVSVIFDTTVLTQTGVYNAVMRVLTDDPMYPVIEAPVTMTVTEPMPSIALTVTVSLDNECGTADSLMVPAGTTVYYCYTVENTGNVMLPNHTITDTVFGHIATFVYDLMPGEAESVIFPQTITADAISTARWVASHAGLGMSAMAEDTVSVTLSMRYIFLPVIIRP